MARRRYRLRFSKRGNLRFIGHRDLLRAVERVLRRARLPVAMSQGFHPKPRVSYLSALPLGFSSDDEAMELILEEELSPDELLARLNSSSVVGLDFLSAIVLDDKTPKQQASSFSYEMRIPEGLVPSVRERIVEFLGRESFEVEQSNGKFVDARAPVLAMTLQGDSLEFTLAAQSGPEVGAREILTCLGLGAELYRSIFPNRSKSTIRDE